MGRFVLVLQARDLVRECAEVRVGFVVARLQLRGVLVFRVRRGQRGRDFGDVRLDLRDNGQIRDLSPLSGLKKLEVLNLHANRIIEVAPLAKLPNLRELILSRNQIDDIAPLETLTTLQQLSLGGNPLDGAWQKSIEKIRGNNPGVELSAK